MSNEDGNMRPFPSKGQTEPPIQDGQPLPPVPPAGGSRRRGNNRSVLLFASLLAVTLVLGVFTVLSLAGIDEQIEESAAAAVEEAEQARIEAEQARAEALQGFLPNVSDGEAEALEMQLLERLNGRDSEAGILMVGLVDFGKSPQQGHFAASLLCQSVADVQSPRDAWFLASAFNGLYAFNAIEERDIYDFQGQEAVLMGDVVDVYCPDLRRVIDIHEDVIAGSTSPTSTAPLE